MQHSVSFHQTKRTSSSPRHRTRPKNTRSKTTGHLAKHKYRTSVFRCQKRVNLDKHPTIHSSQQQETSGPFFPVKLDNSPTYQIGQDSPLYGMLNMLFSQPLPHTNLLPTPLNQHNPPTLFHIQPNPYTSTISIQKQANIDLKRCDGFGSSRMMQPARHFSSASPNSPDAHTHTPQHLNIAIDDLHNDTLAFDTILSQALNQSNNLHNDRFDATTKQQSSSTQFDIDYQVAKIIEEPRGTHIPITTNDHITPSMYRRGVNGNGNDHDVEDERLQTPHSSSPFIKIDLIVNQPASSEREIASGDNHSRTKDYISFEELLKQREYTRNHPPLPPKHKPKLSPFPDQEMIDAQLDESIGYIEPAKPIDLQKDIQFSTHKKDSLLDKLASLDALKAESAALTTTSSVHSQKPTNLTLASSKQIPNSIEMSPPPSRSTSQSPQRTPAQVKQLLFEEAARQQALMDSEAKRKNGFSEQAKGVLSFFKTKMNELDDRIDAAELKSLNYDDNQIKKTQEFLKNHRDFDRKLSVQDDNDKKPDRIGKNVLSLAKKVSPEPVKSLKGLPKNKSGGYVAQEVEDFGGSVTRSLAAAAFFTSIALITGRLCQWQIDRRIWKIALLAQREDAIFQDPLALEDLTTLVTDILENFNMYSLLHFPSPPIDIPAPQGHTLSSKSQHDQLAQDQLFDYFKNKIDEISMSRGRITPGTPLPDDVLATPSVRDHLQTKLNEFYRFFLGKNAYPESSPLHPSHYEDTSLLATARNKSPLTIRDVIGDDGGIYQAFRNQTGTLHDLVKDTGNPLGVSDYELLGNITIDDIINSIQSFKDKSQFHNVSIDGQYDYSHEMLVGPTVPPLDHTGFKNVEIQKGYYIITPCLLYEPFQINLPVKDVNGNHQINLKVGIHSVLVNRGWIPQHLLPTYLNSPLTEHELFSQEDLNILAKRIQYKHDIPGDEPVVPVPFPQYLQHTIEYWDQQDNKNAMETFAKAKLVNRTLATLNMATGEQLIFNQPQHSVSPTHSHEIANPSTTESTPITVDASSVHYSVHPTCAASAPQSTPTSWSWSSLIWGSGQPPTNTSHASTIASTTSGHTKITPYSIEYNSKPVQPLSVQSPQTSPHHNPTLTHLQSPEQEVLPKRIVTKQTPSDIQSYIDANTKWVEETGSRLIYHQHAMNKPKLDRLGLGMNDVFRIDTEAPIHPSLNTQALPLSKPYVHDPNQPFSLITTRQDPLGTPPMPIRGILNYGATFDLYSQGDQTAKINIRGLEHKTAFTFLTAPKFAYDMGLSPATLHIPIKDDHTHTISLLSGDQSRGSMEQAALALHLPIPVVDCQDPVPYRSHVTPILINNDGINQSIRDSGPNNHFDTVRMELRRKGVDDYMKFKTMPETHLGYAVTWGSFSVVATYMAYLQLNRRSVKNWFKSKFSSTPHETPKKL